MAKLEVTVRSMFIAYNKKSATCMLGSVSTTRDLVWDYIYSDIVRGQAKYKREAVKRFESGNWEVLECKVTFPYNVSLENRSV